jgi:PAS domain S-box-containing protein
MGEPKGKMGKMVRSEHSLSRNLRTRGAMPSSTDVKDALLAKLELQETQSQLQIERLQVLLAAEENNSRRLEAIYQHCPVGYVTLDEKGLITEWNHAAADFLEERKRPLFGAPLTFFSVREDVELALAHLRQCKRADGGQVVSELRFKRTDGHILVQMVSVPFRQSDKLFFQTALIDLTETRKNERALEESQNFSETIIHTLHEPLMVVDAKLRIVQSNEAFTNLFKMPGRLAKGMPLETVLNLWWRGNELVKRLEDVFLKNTPLNNIEFEVQPRHQGRRIFLFNARRIQRGENSPPALLIALEDITARKDAEEKLAQSHLQLQQLNNELEKRVEERTRELRTSNKQLESFCYTIAHDLRAPLRAMAGFSATLLDDFSPQLNDRGRSYLEKIVAGGEHMDRLIHDLLDYGRLTTVDFEPKTIDVEEILRSVITQLQPAIDERHATIERKGKLPKIRGHQVVLEAAFSNLIANALKFVPPEKSPRVTIWSEQEDKKVRIWIADNGIGIEPRYHTKIFEVFQQLHSQDAYPGTGIGLAIVRRALQRIGGEVGVESEPGKGSRFWIRVAAAG